MKKPPLLRVGGMTDRVYIVDQYDVIDDHAIVAHRKHDVHDQFEEVARQLGWVPSTKGVAGVFDEEFAAANQAAKVAAKERNDPRSAYVPSPSCDACGRLWTEHLSDPRDLDATLRCPPSATKGTR